MSDEPSRRNTLKTTGLAALAFATGAIGGANAQEMETREFDGPISYELAPLPYAYDALEPAISEEILRIHHDRHHAGYVKGLNATLEKLEAARAGGDYSNIRALARDLAFHGSGHILHALYWNSMTPGGNGRPQGKLADAIGRSFGSCDAMTAQFAAAAKAVEGSGWAVLAMEPTSVRLVILQAENHQNLTIWGVAPLLVCDVWEHAYYLQYENRRGDYVDAFMKIIDWESVGRCCMAAMG